MNIENVSSHIIIIIYWPYENHFDTAVRNNYNLISIPLFCSSATQFKFKNEFIELIAMTASVLPQTLLNCLYVQSTKCGIYFHFLFFILYFSPFFVSFNTLYSVENFLQLRRLLIKFIFLVGLYSVSQYLTVIRLYAEEGIQKTRPYYYYTQGI